MTKTQWGGNINILTYSFCKTANLFCKGTVALSTLGALAFLLLLTTVKPSSKLSLLCDSLTALPTWTCPFNTGSSPFRRATSCLYSLIVPTCASSVSRSSSFRRATSCFNSFISASAVPSHLQNKQHRSISSSTKNSRTKEFPQSEHG